MRNQLSAVECCMAALVLLTSLSTDLAGAVFMTGDVFAGLRGTGNVNWYRADGTFVQTLSTGATGDMTGMAFDSAGRLYATNFHGGIVFRFDTDGTPLGVFANNGFNSLNESVVFDAAGNIYVGLASASKDILKRDASGALIASYNVAIEGNSGADLIDLAADQTTIFYTNGGRQIKRFDLSTNTQLSDFATLPGTFVDGSAGTLRLLSDGGLLVADRSNIKRVDSSGMVVQTYDLPFRDDWYGLSLDSNGTSFWSGDWFDGVLHKFNIATGALEQTILTGQSLGVAVYGEVRQGVGGAVVVAEPMSMAIWGLLAAVAIRGRRRWTR